MEVGQKVYANLGLRKNVEGIVKERTGKNFLVTFPHVSGKDTFNKEMDKRSLRTEANVDSEDDIVIGRTLTDSQRRKFHREAAELVVKYVKQYEDRLILSSELNSQVMKAMAELVSKL